MIEIRELTDDDLGFLGEMLYAALAWNPDAELPPIEFVLEHPQAVIYHRGWGRRGDAGYVAEEDGWRIGARRHLASSPRRSTGTGTSTTRAPKLGIAVVDGFRGRGVGGLLLDALHERARRDGLRRVALSVEPENPAKRLYARHGYVEFEPGDGHGRMLLELD